MDRFNVITIVGEGSFGKVYKATENNTNSTVALKVIGKRGRSTKELKGLRKECEIQSKLCHPNIIQMFESFETENEIVVVTEFAKGDLHSLLAREGSIGEERAQKLTYNLVSALYYLHSHRILHRDLKPQNILLDENEKAKLCDFGLARNMTMGTHVLTSIKGTPLYMAPELMAEKPYDHHADLWSLGCIIYEVLVGQPPFCTTSILHLVRLIRHENVKWPSFLTDSCISFLKGLLEKDPKLRMTWPQILNHNFVIGNITILDEDIPESPFTQSMTDSQSFEKQKQTNEILSAGRLSLVIPNIPLHGVNNQIQAKKISLLDENLMSSRDSVHAVLQSDLEGIETDTDESLQIARRAVPDLHQQPSQKSLPQMMNDLHLNDIVFVSGNPNLIINHLNDNFPSSNNWNANTMFPHNLPNCMNAMLIQSQQKIDELEKQKQTTGTKKKSKPPKNSELEKRKLSQNLDNFSLRLGQSQDLDKSKKSDYQTTETNVLTYKPPQSKIISSPSVLPGWDSCDESHSPPIENDEWIAFLQRSMQEVLDGELESLKQQNLVSIIVSPLRNAKASCKVLESVAQLLCLPLILCGPATLLTDIQKVYVEVKLVPNLVYASKLLCSKSSIGTPTTPLPTSPIYDIEPVTGLSIEEIRTLSTLYELVCHLVHLETQFLSQFCDAIAILGADKLLINFLSNVPEDNHTMIRLANNVLALLSCALRELPENAELIEKIIFDDSVDLIKLFRHCDTLIKTRMCMLFGLLGRFSCRAVQSHWNIMLRDALELLACDENDEVKTEAESILEEFKHLSFYSQSDLVY